MKRTIAAILAADVVGYSRLIAADEEGTIRRLAEHGAVFREQVAAFRGRVFNTAGDAILAEFPSAVEALRAAIAIQSALRLRDPDEPPERKLAFRMGLTIGDVVEVGGDLLGDGVNIAARLEGLAEAGGICLSRSVHEAVANKVDAAFRDIGPQRLKNIPRPVHAFRVVWPAGPGDRLATPLGRLRRLASSKPWLAAAIPALALAIALAAGWVALHRADPSEAAAPAEEATALAVSVARARQVCFKDNISLSGTLAPRREVEVRPERDGLVVVSVSAEPMAVVAAGDVLAQLARPDHQGGATIALRAPISGIVGRVSAAPGALVTARSPPLFQIIAQGELELAAEAPLVALGRLAPGQPASITPIGAPAIAGSVRTVSAPADAATQAGRARITVKGAPDLRQGAFASAVVEIEERCGVGIPLSAVMIGGEGRFVYVVEGGRIEGRPVTTGLSAGRDVEALGGLRLGEAVVARAGPFLREGAAITPVFVAASGPVE